MVGLPIETPFVEEVQNKDDVEITAEQDLFSRRFVGDRGLILTVLAAQEDVKRAIELAYVDALPNQLVQRRVVPIEELLGQEQVRAEPGQPSVHPRLPEAHLSLPTGGLQTSARTGETDFVREDVPLKLDNYMARFSENALEMAALVEQIEADDRWNEILRGWLEQPEAVPIPVR